MYEPKFLGWRDEPEVVIEEVDINRFRDKCRRCGREMCDYRWWYQQPREWRRKAKKELVPVGARKLCNPCYTHLLKRYPDELAEYDTKNQKMSDFVEDYLIYFRRTESRSQIARLMGIGDKAFEHKYYRAKRMGLI